MQTNIVLTGVRLSSNFGGPSILVAIKTALSHIFPDAEYTLFVPYSYYESDVTWAQKYGVKIVPLISAKRLFPSALLNRCSGVSIGSLYVKNAIRLLKQADLIVDIRGIIFADNLGGNSLRGRMSEGLIFVIGRVLGKSVIKYTSSFGPFNHRWNRLFARICLGSFTKLILARDETSRKHLDDLNIKTRTLTVPDTAFLLPTSESRASARYAQIRKKHPLVGLSVSFQARNRSPTSTDYILIMADFVQYLIDKYASHIVLIPNEQSKGLNNDHRIAEEISQKVNNVQCDVLDTDNLLAQEIKGVIQQCEVIVAARYHTIVASLSLGIPTLAIAWHHKYDGVLSLFGQQIRGQLINIEDLSFEDLVEKFDDLWKNREEIRQTIISSIPDVKSRIAAGARVVREVMSVKAK